DSNGIKIIDRVKEIFKLSQGEYIAPSKLEAIYNRCRYVSQICVYGNSHHTFIIAIIVINKNNVIDFLTRSGKNVTQVEDHLKDRELMNEIKNNLDALVKENKVNGLEKIHNFILATNESTIDNGCLTPSMKMVRKKI